MTMTEVGTFQDTDALQRYIDAGRRIGASEHEVRDAMSDMTRGPGEVTLDIEGQRLDSWRIETGVIDEKFDLSRGGIEESDTVYGGKVANKSLLMLGKHIFYDQPLDPGVLDIREAAEVSLIHFLNTRRNIPMTVGGKGGIHMPASLRETLKNSTEADQRHFRDLMYGQFAEAHGINPWTNVAALDVGNSPFDSDAIVRALTGQHGEYAKGAVAGANVEYGGIPDWACVRTGLGAKIGTAQMVHLSPELRAKMAAGKRLTAKVQGHGKAALPFSDSDYGMDPVGILERNGGLASTTGEPLNVDHVTELARKYNFLEEGMHVPRGMRWVSQQAFWGAEVPADVFAGGAAEGEVTGERAEQLHESGVRFVTAVANALATPGGERVMRKHKMEYGPGEAMNAGGTNGSKARYNEIMQELTTFDYGADPSTRTERWTAQMTDVPADIANRVQRVRALRGEFVPITDITDEIFVAGALARAAANRN